MPAPQPPPDDSETRRRKLVGRLAVIGLLLLVLAYAVPMFLR